jgi:hypothetical protein
LGCSVSPAKARSQRPQLAKDLLALAIEKGNSSQRLWLLMMAAIHELDLRSAG